MLLLGQHVATHWLPEGSRSSLPSIPHRHNADPRLTFSANPADDRLHHLDSKTLASRMACNVYNGPDVSLAAWHEPAAP